MEQPNREAARCDLHAQPYPIQPQRKSPMRRGQTLLRFIPTLLPPQSPTVLLLHSPTLLPLLRNPVPLPLLRSLILLPSQTPALLPLLDPTLPLLIPHRPILLASPAAMRPGWPQPI